MAVLFATDNPCHYEVSRQDTNYVVSTIYDHHVLLLQQFSLLLFIDALGRYQDVLLTMRSNEKVVCPEVFSILQITGASFSSCAVINDQLSHFISLYVLCLPSIHRRGDI